MNILTHASRAAVLGVALAAPAHSQPSAVGVAPVVLDDSPYYFDTAEQHGIRVDVLVRRLDHPFSLAFLPGGDALVVERGKALRRIADATGAARLVTEPVGGTPPAGEFRGAGLHDIELHPEFATNRLVYYTYNRAGEPAAGTESPGRPAAVTLARARLAGGALVDAEVLFEGEINLIRPGRNYGWPDYSFGRTYEGPRHSEVPLGENTAQPLLLWIPSVAPTGMTFYSGTGIEPWAGNLFVGSSRTGQIPRTGGLERIVLTDELGELRRESLLRPLRQRIRDVREGPDGLLYVITDEDDGALLRISPAGLPADAR